MHFKLTFSVIFVGLLLLLPRLAHAEELKIGVAIGATINASPEVSVAVSEAVGTALQTKLKVSAIGGAQAQSMLPEEAKAETCLGDSACLVQAAKALQVDQLLMLVVVGVGEEIKIEATWVEVATNQTALRPALTLSTDPALMSAELLTHVSDLLPDAELRKPVVVGADDSVVDTAATTQTQQMRPARGNHLTGLSTGLFIGGGLALTGSLAYGAYRLFKCDGRDCGASKDFNGIADGIGVAGAVSLSIASYLYFTSGEPESPIALQVNDDSFAVSYGGRF